MKKIAKITALGLSCAFALSLAACGDDTTPGKNPGKGPDPSDIKSDYVMETEWKNAFDFSEVTNVTFKSTDRMTVMGQSDETYDIVMFDGNKIYSESVGYNFSDGGASTGAMPQKTTDKEYYSVSDDAAYVYEYNKTAKEWEKSEAEWYPTIEFYAEEISSLADAYSSFTYNKSKGAYVATELSDFEDWDSVSVKIKGGKVSVIQMDSSETESGITISESLIYQAYDFGTTKVTLPKVDGDDDGDEGDGEGGGKDESGAQVTKAQWNAAVSPQAFYNVTAKYTPDQGGSSIYKYDYSNGCVLREYDDSSSLYVYQDDYCYMYSLNNGKWHYDDKTQSYSFEQNLSSVTIIVGIFDYDSFTFKDGKYTAKNYTVAGMPTSITEVNMVFNQGKLVKCDYTATFEGETMHEELEFTDYGKTTVDASEFNLPSPDGGEGEDDGPYKVTEKEWNSALDAKNFYNVTCVQTVTVGDESEHVLRKYDDATECISVDDEYTMIFSEGKCYDFEQVDGEWAYTGGSYATFDEYVMHWIVLNVNAFDYGAFTYKDGIYTANNYTVHYINGETFEGGVILDKVSLMIKEGRLVWCEYTFTYEGETVVNVFEFSDYGNTNVERPNVIIPEIGRRKQLRV